jgi:leucyl-tRNA synthetase
LDKVWNLQEKVTSVIASHSEAIPKEGSANNGIAASPKAPRNDKLQTMLHQTIQKVGEDIEAMRFNTAIAKMMGLVNEMSKEESLPLTHYSLLLKILSPFAPHLCEEIWENLGYKETLVYESWPEYNQELTKENEITLAVQINGKVRDTLVVSAEISEDEAKKLALASEKAQKWLEGKEPKKVIYVKGKLVSIVV